MSQGRASWICWGFVALVAVACASAAPPRERKAVFNEAEYSTYDRPGTAVLRGQAFMRTRGGDVKTAAGSQVFLNPWTSYSAEWFAATLEGVAMAPPDGRAARFSRVVQADADGRFEFTGLPDGVFLVLTTVRWEAATGYHGALQPQGAAVGAKVSLTPGESRSVILTR